ncbi:DUF3426 domain-containing protein [Marinobacterium lutimaris]|uniref:MJ0042 family finger-like domain-containing protein n=1 Tax=Marinobacterium lutimaris TaxID=568106 RepID=A0A1H6CH82_9GAMM|nr:DUF3426 domain-containing protein [Marinobacterium lutimaris]SEG72359.1 MJ0042 family finger-like domain-containing protein [Marinobacterium lutimaris]
MNEPIVTECPSCHSRFRVTQGQLRMAQGQVRCGACLQVFDARTEAHRLERRLENRSQKRRRTALFANAPAATQPVQSEPSGVSIKTDELKAYLGAITGLGAEKKESTPNTSTEPAESAPATAEAEPTYSPAAPLSDQENHQRALQQEPQSETLPEADTGPEPEPNPEAEPAYLRTGADQAEAEVRTQASEPQSERTSLKVEPESDTENPPEPGKPAMPAEAQTGEAQASVAGESSEFRPADTSSTEATETIREQDIPHLYAEPITLEVSREQSDPFAIAGWTLASLVAAAILLGQVFWFERDKIALLSDFSPLYTLVCESLPCELDSSAYDNIENLQMVVRPHPSFADALRVDIRLQNNAAFRQPYPALGLTFSNVRGQVVARRIFHPGEYLDNGRQNARMPSQVPVEIQLEITDPGEGALSYTLDLLPER